MYNRVMFSAMISSILFIVLMFMGIEMGYLGTNGTLLEEGRVVYWTCNAIALAVLWRSKTLDASIGSVFAVILGPWTLLTFFFVWLSLKLFPAKVPATTE